VSGQATRPGHSFTADEVPAPLDPYGMSKLEAEQGLREIEAQTGVEVVIVRPPLVYGPGVKVNSAYMMVWLARGIPLPFGAIRNMLPVPAFVLERDVTLPGKRAAAQRLCSSLQLDIKKTRQVLGWTPPVSVDEGLRRAVQGFGQ
jgi:nucleoside-diphosphate-sugar epimerase